MSTTIKFTRREREILEMICHGSAAKRIAYELEISIPTVNSHLARMCLHAKVSRTELVIYALQNPAAFVRGGLCSTGLHPVGCDCDSPYCKGMRRTAA